MDIPDYSLHILNAKRAGLLSMDIRGTSSGKKTLFQRTDPLNPPATQHRLLHKTG
jgi:hypothetical protein